MGHKRLGYLPKTKAWRIIIAEMGKFTLGGAEVASITKNTLQNVQSRFNRLSEDPSIQSSFEFLLHLSYAFQKENPVKYLTEKKILEKSEISLLKIGRAARDYKKEGEVESHEYQTFARQAAIDAINNFYNTNAESGRSFFNNNEDTVAIFSKVGNGNGFCELSRMYFSKLTERYLKYFLEREAATRITKTSERNKFSSEIEKHVNEISKHAFETAKITQSFSAGWYNKNAVKDFPTKNEVKGFLSYAFGKMKSELLMEESN